MSAETLAPDGAAPLEHLAPEHAALITGSAISPAVAVYRGYRTVENADELLAEGYGKRQAKHTPGVLVPMFDVTRLGRRSGSQFRADKPRRGKDGKLVKYDTPKGARNMLDVHPTMQQDIGNTAVPIVFTEGVRKADALTSLGFVTIALSGVWNWRGEDEHGVKGPLPGFDSIALDGRQAILIFDSDARSNENVLTALARLKIFLESRGATVVCVLPPSADDDGKVGIDDYLAAGGDIEALLAEPFELDTTGLVEWPPVEELIRGMLEAVEREAGYRLTPDDPSLFTGATLLDVILTRPCTPYCAFGKAMAMSHREKGVVQNGYFRCRGAKCPHCCSYWILQVMRRVWGHFDYPSVLHRSNVTDAMWNGRELKRLRLASSWVWIRTGDDERELFTVEPHAGSELVDEPARAVLEALLRAPAAGARRYGGLEKEAKPPSEWSAFTLPHGSSPEDACALCSAALGRELDWQLEERARGGPFYRRWLVKGLTAAEVDRVREALLPLRQMSERTHAEQRQARRVLRENEREFAEMRKRLG